MSSPVKPLLDLMKMAVKSKYKTLFLQNRMILQCYDLAVDSTVGLHYVLPIPDTEAYSDPLYDMDLVITPASILAAYAEGHKQVDVQKKEKGLKAKDLKETFSVYDGKHGPVLSFEFSLQDEYVCSTKIPLKEIDPDSTAAMNVVTTYEKLMYRVKEGGAKLSYNGKKLNLVERVSNCPEVYFYKAKMGKEVIRVPFTKSSFVGINKPDVFRFGVSETNDRDVFVYELTLGKGGLEEIFWGYIINF